MEMLDFEKKLYKKGITLIGGIDEVGRGPLVGPVVASCVILPKNFYNKDIKDKNILWFIPLISKITKYEEIVNKKTKRYGSCRSIMIREIANKKSVILLQNAFPTLEKYIDHPHVVNGKPLKVIDTLKDEILDNFKYLLALKKEGRNLFFTDIDRIKEIMLKELK